jgi:K+-sensing histidine kinase KdpD
MTIRDFTRASARGDLDVAATTGTLLVYLGVAPGAGTTCAMLDEAHWLRRAGTDVVASFIDCHGRAGTRERAAGLEVILWVPASTSSRPWMSSSWTASPARSNG